MDCDGAVVVAERKHVFHHLRGGHPLHLSDARGAWAYRGPGHGRAL
jgi:hypothetical protein